MAIVNFNPLATIQALLPTTTVDTVAIFTSGGTQLFKNARPLKVLVREQAKVMEHPTETGTIISDHRIILPIDIDISILVTSVDYPDVYKAIKQYYANATLLTVQTRTGTYTNQVIAALPHQEDADIYNGITIALSMRQIRFVTPQYGIVPQSPTDATTVDRGTQQGTAATNTEVNSALSSFNNLKVG